MAQSYIEDERELYHFHFNSSQFYEDFCELAENTTKKTLNSLEELLLTKFPTDEVEIKREITKLNEAYEQQSREPLLKFKETAREIFKLPSNVLLPGDIEDKVVTNEEVDQMQKEADDLEQLYIEEVHRRAKLKGAIKKFEHVEPLFKTTNEILRFYKENKPKPGEKSTRDLMKVLNECEEFYQKKKCNDEDQSKEVSDIFGVFKTE